MQTMGTTTKLLKFGIGSITGTAVGAAVASLLAPQRGEDLQSAVKSVLSEAEEVGNREQAGVEQMLQQRFRDSVNDQDALRSSTNA